MFKIKPFADIIASMLAHSRSVQRIITDFNVGSVNRTMHEASAIELDQLYQEMGQGLIEGIPTAIYRSFDFELQPALAASGLVRFMLAVAQVRDVTIPTGTTVASRSSGVQYRTVERTIIPAGSLSVEVLVVASTPGLAGNAAPGAIATLVSSGLGAPIAVRNERAFSNGRGLETEAERKLRFIEYVRTLAKGTVAAVEYACRLTQLTDPITGAVVERVDRVTIEETQGHVTAWIYNGAGSTSAALVRRGQDLVDGHTEEGVGTLVPGYRPTGMRVDVAAMTEIPVPVVLEAQVPLAQRTEANRSRIVQAVSGMIRATPSDGFLRPLDLVNAMLTVPAVTGGDIESPTLSVPCPINAVLVPGTIEVTWA